MSAISILYKNKISRVIFLLPILFLSIYYGNESFSIADLRYINLRPLLNVFLPITVLLAALIVIYIREIPVKMNAIDFSLLAFTLFLVSNYGFRHESYNEILVLLSCVAVGAVLVKQVFLSDLPGRHFFRITLFGITGLGILEALYGQLQIFGIGRVNSVQSVVIGSFYYPGPFAIMVSSVLVFSCGVVLFREKIADNKWLVRLSMLFIMIAIPVIPSTQSRSAWMGLLAGLVFLVYARYKEELVQFFTDLKKGFLFFLSLAILAVLSVYGGYLLYSFKAESVHGRLRVWDIALRYFTHNPVTGIGHGQFKYEYGRMQREFIGDRINDLSIIPQTDYVKYVFNDFLQILMENGLVGLLLFSAYLFLALRNITSEAVREQPYLVSAIAAFGGILVSCLFSYPMEMPLVLTVFFLFGAIISFHARGAVFTVKTGSVLSDIVLLSAILFTLGLFQKEVVMTKGRATEWAQGGKLYEDRRFEEAIPHFETAIEMVPGDPEIPMAYGRALYMAGNYERSEYVLTEVANLVQDPMVYLNLGDACLEQGKYTLAEQAYKMSVSISPDRLYPRYRLARLYKQVGDTASARREVRNMLRLRVPVSSPASDSIRREMNRMLGARLK